MQYYNFCYNIVINSFYIILGEEIFLKNKSKKSKFTKIVMVLLALLIAIPIFTFYSFYNKLNTTTADGEDAYQSKYESVDGITNILFLCTDCI